METKNEKSQFISLLLHTKRKNPNVKCFGIKYKYGGFVKVWIYTWSM